jgi:hypothetical protein
MMAQRIYGLGGVSRLAAVKDRVAYVLTLLGMGLERPRKDYADLDYDLNCPLPLSESHPSGFAPPFAARVFFETPCDTQQQLCSVVRSEKSEIGRFPDIP